MLRRYGVIFFVVSIGSLIACGGGDDGRLSSECRDAIYANIRLSNADGPRRFYVQTKLEDWTQGQLAAAVDEGGYLENVWPCSTEVKREFNRRGYTW